MSLANSNYIDTAQQTLFRLIFPKMPSSISLKETKDFILYLHTVNVLGISLSSNEHHWQGAKIPYPEANLEFPELTVSFIIDESFNNWIIFYKWLIMMNDNKKNFGKDFKEYSTDAILLCKNNWMKTNSLKLQFFGIWPLSLGDISLTTRSDGSELLECDVTFQYDRYELVE